MKGKGTILVPFIVLFLSLFLSPNLPVEVNRVMHDTGCKIHDNRASQGDPQSEISNPPSVNSNPSNPQSTIKNPKFQKTEVIQKAKKIQSGLVYYRKGEGYEK
mgnify:CR=1 FL=1